VLVYFKLIFIVAKVIMVTGGYGLVGYGIQAVVNSGSGDEWSKKDDEVGKSVNFVKKTKI